MVKTRVLVLVLLALFLVSLALCLVFFLPKPNKTNSVANVYVDGELVWSVDLSSAGEMQKTIETPYGVNIIEVNNRRIRVLDADCPDKVCVNSGWREAGGAPIVCLPHKLVVKMSGSGVDAVSE